MRGGGCRGDKRKGKEKREMINDDCMAKVAREINKGLASSRPRGAEGASHARLICECVGLFVCSFTSFHHCRKMYIKASAAAI